MESEDPLLRLRRLEELVDKHLAECDVTKRLQEVWDRLDGHLGKAADPFYLAEPMIEVAFETDESFVERLSRLERLLASHCAACAELPKQLEELHHRIDSLAPGGTPHAGTPRAGALRGATPPAGTPLPEESEAPGCASMAGNTDVLASATTQFTALHEQLTKIRQESEREEQLVQAEVKKQTRFVLMPGSMSLSLTLLPRKLLRLGTPRLPSAKAVTFAATPFALPHSCWGGLALLGVLDFGVAASVLSALGAALAAVLQLLFCWVLAQGLLEGSYDLGNLTEWRLAQGHNAAFYDPISGSSLASRLCRDGEFDAQGVLEEARRYLAPALGEAHLGVVLGGMALLIWACYVAVELETMLGLAYAINQLPPKVTSVEQAEDQRTFQSISYTRCLGLTCLLCCRCALLLILGVVGGIWLTRLQDVADILRDCVTLVMILEVDDLAYRLLTPNRAKMYIGSIRTFMLRDGQEISGGLKAGLRKLFCLALAVSLFVVLGCLHSATLAGEVSAVLCGGNVNFVFATHPSLGAPLVLDTESYDPAAVAWEQGWTRSYPAQLEGTFYNVSLPQGTSAVKRAASYPELLAYLALSDRQASEQGFGTGCEDLSRASAEGTWLWPVLEAATGATNCQQAKPFCDRRDLPLLRMLCPSSCGCLAATSGLYVGNGCRTLCQREASEWNQSLQVIPCQDMQTPGDLRNSAWTRWWQGFYQAHQNDASADVSLLAFAAASPRADCSLLNTQDGLRDAFCRAGEDRPGAALCPEACGCANGAAPISAWCPDACS